MSEVVTVFTVPGQFILESSVKRTTKLHKVVGTVNPDGRELWLPSDPESYLYGGGYSNGYSNDDIQEKQLTIEAKYAKRFAEFIGGPLLGQGWYDIGLSAERYDCHWFGSWMKNMVTLDSTTDESLELAGKVVREGEPVDEVPAGEVGVVGARFGIQTQPIHTYFGLPDGQCLQVLGVHNVIAIAPQRAVIQHYLELSGIGDFLAGAYFGPHMLRSS